MSWLSQFIGKDAAREARNLNAQSMAKQDEIQKKIDAFAETIEPAKQEMAKKLTEAYAQTAAMLDEAVKRGDTKLETIYSDQLKVMDEHAKNELGLAPRQYQDFKELIDSQSAAAVDLIRGDIRANKMLQREYKKQADTAVETYAKGLQATQARIDEMRKRGGLPEGSEQALAKQEATITEAKQNLARAEGLKLGGARARRLGLDVEAARAKGDLVAQLRASGRAELSAEEANKMNIAGGLENLASKRLDATRETAGAQELAARTPFMAASQQNLARLQGQEADIASQKRDLTLRRAGTDVALDQWGQEQKGAVLGAQTRQMATVADLLSNQAAQAQQRSEQARSTVMGLVGTAATLGAGAYLGGSGALAGAGIGTAGQTGFSWTGAKQGAMAGLTGGAFGLMGKNNYANTTKGARDITPQIQWGQFNTPQGNGF